MQELDRLVSDLSSLIATTDRVSGSLKADCENSEKVYTSEEVKRKQQLVILEKLI